MSYDVGKFLLAGFSGQNCASGSHVYLLIVKHRVSALLIKSENYQSGKQLKKLISDIQSLASSHNYEKPVLICIDPEIGKMNIFYDDPIICKFPCEMALSSTGDLDLIRKIGEVTAIQWKSIGVNMYIGPILDICEKNINKVIGVHSFGTTKEQVIKYAGNFCKGLKDGGIIVCAKHFPGNGNGIFDDMTETLTVLDSEYSILSNSVFPYKEMINQGNLDAVTVSNAAFPNVSDLDYIAFLTPKIVKGILRNRLGFNGVAIGECLEVDIVYTSWGIGQAAALAILNAGCDMVTICDSYDNQCEALKYLTMAFQDESKESILLSCLSRINELTKTLSWDKLNFDLSPKIINEYRQLSDLAYGESIFMPRDYDNIIPLTSYFMKKKKEYERIELLNLNLPPYKFIKIVVLSPNTKDLNINGSFNCEYINKTELDVTFKEFINYLSSYSLMHTYHVNQIEYGLQGLTYKQEKILANSDLIILITVDARVNTYQLGIVKKLTIIVEHLRDKINLLSKQLIILSTGIPYEFTTPTPIAATFICCYDYSFFAFRNVCKLLFGDLIPRGGILEHDSNKNNISNDFLNKNWDFNGGLNKTYDNECKINRGRNSGKHEYIGESGFKKGNRDNTNNDDDLESTRIKPWVVEEFEFNKDILPTYVMSKINSITELLDIFEDHTFHRLGEVYKECDGDLKIFIIKNSSTGNIYGFIITYYEKFSKTGQILYISVSKWKRRQEIGKALHKHVVRYFCIEKQCQNISLGCVFPLYILFSPSVFKEFKSLLELGELNNKNKTITNSFQFIEFFKSSGWSNNSKYGFIQQEERNILKLDILRNWVLPGTNEIIPYEGQKIPLILNFNSSTDFMSKIQHYGIKFKLLDDDIYPQEILNEYISRNELIDEEEVRFPNIYKFANKFKSLEGLTKKATIILGAFIKDVPIGSLVIYSKQSKLGAFYSFIDNVGKFEDNACGITAVLVTHEEILKSVNNGIEIDKALIKLSLITTGVQIVKGLNIKHVLLHNILNDNVCIYETIGFERFRVYYSDFGLKKAFKWVL